ncbi:vanadium-dependent haloperoxidase [Dinghuibacter silviterrae]|uniref:PAP2 superfamily protein n=1 Tax=Dinghuibacter silviterrae TaxID=1539049 RepID=A0A4R8DGQ4_9BACT|nr:vanadium-dependent haloperoxidase [Dinghuibacter silviterrae]TDW96685.1 PAP2 superfamily protein [Dinghuibacter silviterrae]
MMRKNIGLLFLAVGHLCQAQNGKEKVLTDYLRPAVFSLTMVMVHDVVNPPAACRYYTYAMLGAYDLVSAHDTAIARPSGFIQGFPKGEPDAGYDYKVAAAFSILETGRLMLPSGYRLEDEEQKFVELLKKQKWPQDIIDRSLEAGRKASARVVAWSKGDHYNLLSAKLRYTPKRTDSTWYPTPPAYMEAVEPNWRIIRPVFIDSADQFIPPPPVSFSKDSASTFYHLARAVYDVSKDTGALSLRERTIASFWDCNPFAIATSGHMMIGLKKISPGGHWMEIAGIASSAAGLDFDHTIQVQTLVAATMMDAFISCWDEKYRTNRIRPETYINRYIDVQWHPLLQTPPFPEYTSGHSVVSTAAAEVLTYLLGQQLDYTDDAERLFDIQPRRFHSFRDAAAEAAISRFYGGIHYLDSIVNGQVEGKALAAYVVALLAKAGVRPLRMSGLAVN